MNISINIRAKSSEASRDKLGPKNTRFPVVKKSMEYEEKNVEIIEGPPCYVEPSAPPIEF